MTYNLLFKNADFAQSLALIKDANPDVLFVQELTPAWSATLDKEIKEIYQFKVAGPLIGHHGIAIYSKYSLENKVILRNSAKKPYTICADLTFGKRKIQLINTHLASPGIAVENKKRFIPLYAQNYKTRKQQIQELNSLVNTEDYDCQILAGDLNTLQSEPIFKRLRMHWVDSGNQLFRWKQFNFPNTSRLKPMMTLDYIMGRGNIQLQDSEIIKGGYSDHFPVMTTVRI